MIFGILVAVIGLGIVALIMIAVCFPELITNFTKKIIKYIRRITGHSSTNQVASMKNRYNSPQNILMTKIEALTEGQALFFKINPQWGSNFITVELNTNFPVNGKKYVVSLRDSPDPSDGNKKIHYYSNDIQSIANSIIEREGILFIPDHLTPELEKESLKTGTKNQLLGMRG